MPFQQQYHIATDDTLRETISHGNGRYSFAYYWEDVWQFDFHRIDWHWHHEVEFIIVTDGTLQCLIGEDTVEIPAGSGLFVNSGVLHRYEAVCERCIVPNIVFSPALIAPPESLIYEKYVLPVINSSVSYCIFNPQTDWQNHILTALSQVYSLQENKKKNELLTLQLLLKIWNHLSESLEVEQEVSHTRRVDHRQAKLQLMMQYVHDHYSETITLDRIAATASVSKSSALHIFQSYIHTSPISYLIHYRLKCAGQQLRTTEKSVSVIASETGFSSTGYFCRKFKEYYHMSPIAYRGKEEIYRHDFN